MKVFISHSATDDDDAKVVLTSVTRGLREKNYDVCLDWEELKGGDKWASKLYLRLAECNAAVVLLSPKAIKSHWVRREVNILLWRQALGAPLHIVPALIGGIGPEDLVAAGFSELEPVQAVKAIDPDGSLTASVISSEIVKRFADRPGEDTSPMSEWIKNISACIEGAKQRAPSVVLDAARDLRVAEEEIGQVELPDGSVLLAHQFLAPDRLQDAPTRGDACDAFAKLMHHMPEDSRETLATLIKPTWVNGESARRLLVIRDDADAPVGGVVMLNAYDGETAEEYIDRASCCATRGYKSQTVTGVTGENFVTEVMKQAELAVRYFLGLRQKFPLEKALAELPSDLGACYLIVDPHDKFDEMDVVAKAVREVRATYPWVTVILLTGADPPSKEQVKEWQFGSDAVVLPDLKDENEGSRMVNELEAMLSKMKWH